MWLQGLYRAKRHQNGEDVSEEVFMLLPHVSPWWGFVGTSSFWAKPGRDWKRNQFSHHPWQMNAPDTRRCPCLYRSCSLIHFPLFHFLPNLATSVWKVPAVLKYWPQQGVTFKEKVAQQKTKSGVAILIFVVGCSQKYLKLSVMGVWTGTKKQQCVFKISSWYFCHF